MQKLIIALCTSTTLLCTPNSSASAAESFSCTTDDGVILKGDYYGKESKKPTVVLMHMLGRSRADYAPLIPLLQKKGFAVLAIDLRGHGESTGRLPRKVEPEPARYSFDRFTLADWARLPYDVKAVLKTLSSKSTDNTALANQSNSKKPQPESTRAHSRAGGNSGGGRTRRILLVGASIGANAAALAGADVADVKAMVLLSPGANYHKLAPAAAIEKFAGPVLIVVSSEDEQSYDACKQFSASSKATGHNIKLETLKDAGHGTKMFGKDPQLAGKIADWLAGIK